MSTEQSDQKEDKNENHEEIANETTPLAFISDLRNQYLATLFVMYAFFIFGLIISTDNLETFIESIEKMSHASFIVLVFIVYVLIYILFKGFKFFLVQIPVWLVNKLRLSSIEHFADKIQSAVKNTSDTYRAKKTFIHETIYLFTVALISFLLGYHPNSKVTQKIIKKKETSEVVGNLKK